MALLDAIVLPVTLIAAVLFELFRPALQQFHSAGVMLACMGRSLPLDVLMAYLLVKPLSSRNPDNRVDEIVRNTVAWTTMISLLFSKVGDTCLEDDSFYLLGMLCLGAARLVSLIGAWQWWGKWRKLNPHWALTDVMTGGFRRSLFGQLIVLVAALVWWRPTTCFITLLYFLLLLSVAAIQMACWGVCMNNGTWWGAVSGILFVLSHLPMIATGHGPMAGGWSQVVYYIAQTAYTLSAKEASIGGASIFLISRG